MKEFREKIYPNFKYICHKYKLANEDIRRLETIVCSAIMVGHQLGGLEDLFDEFEEVENLSDHMQGFNDG